MARKTVALVHTSSSLVPVFDQLCKEKNLDVNLVHIEDASLINDVISQGLVSAETANRVLEQIASAEKSAPDCVMVTCSSIGPAVDAAQQKFKTPILRVDQPLADRAVALGSKIGVVATLITTMVPTTELLERSAKKIDKKIELTTELCNEAFTAYANGDYEKHDAAVLDAIKRMAPNVDAIVLAQASMARAVGNLSAEEIGVPILSSPSLAVDYLAKVL